MNMTIADQLRRHVNESGYTARGLATKAGVPASAVVRFINATRDLHLATAAKLCEALGLRLVEDVRPARAARKPAAKKAPA